MCALFAELWECGDEAGEVVGVSECLVSLALHEHHAQRIGYFVDVANISTSQHRVSPFQLIDRTKPGHRRFIALWLVDPTKRIISTANVPPQQMSWYIESLLGTSPEARKEALTKLPAELVALLQEKGLPEVDGLPAGNAKLPEELMDMVRKYFDEEGEAMPMGLEEAREHREKLMQERGVHHQAAEREWQSNTYNFCEH
jgi:hypothetical protein